MATQTQLRRGTAAQNNSFTGAVGELSYDTENKSIRVHDGSTAGGIEVLTGNGDISAKTSDGAALTLETSDTTVTDGSVLGKIEFKAPNEASGTDAILVGAAIEAVAEGTFAADNNATELVFKTGASAAADAKMVISSSGAVTAKRPRSNTSGDAALIVSPSDTTISYGFRVDNANNALNFDRVDNTTTLMSLNHVGNILIGTTAEPSSSQTGVRISGTDGQNFWKSSNSGTSGYDQLAFFNGNGLVGTISTSGSATAYNTSSDYRLKTDAQPMTGASDRVLALNPVNFEWIADGTRVDGFLAHEAQAVVPECVTGTKDAMRDEEYTVTSATGDIYTPATDEADEVIHSTNVEQPETLEDGKQWRETTPAVMGTRSVPDMQGIDQSKMVPLLVASLQEALARITALETRLTALENA